jgi:hypothetical protein
MEHRWMSQVTGALESIPDEVFFEKDGSPLDREVSDLDSRLYKFLIRQFGENVEKDFSPMVPENQFSVDFFIPTLPGMLVEVEKGKLPRLELDLMKILGSIYRFPSQYGFGCIVVPVNYIKLNLAGKRSPYKYVTGNLLPLNMPLLDIKAANGMFLVKDFLVIGYVDPRGT